MIGNSVNKAKTVEGSKALGFYEMFIATIINKSLSRLKKEKKF